MTVNSRLVYVAGRFVLGFGNSMSQLSSPVLLTEIAHPQHRGRVTTLYNCLWNLGALCKHEYICFRDTGRELTIAQSLPGLPGLPQLSTVIGHGDL